ncbi:hypothetical protein B566_EDAN000968 [Ephemera danica]|nr:hypothetical protein B566_EDAN000968 [Ephemera danica]
MWNNVIRSQLSLPKVCRIIQLFERHCRKSYYHSFEQFIPACSKISVNSKHNVCIKAAEDPQNKLKLSFLPKIHKVVQLEEDSFAIEVGGDQDEGKQCLIEVPVQSNLAVACTANASVEVSNMHAENIGISTDSGSILTKDIRCGQVLLLTQGGNIGSRGVLQGNIHLTTRRNGTIECQRIQGRYARIQTEKGDIKSSSSYCDESYFQTTDGNLTLSNMHRKCNVTISNNGNLRISGLDGSLDATINEGNAEIQASVLTGDCVIFVKKGDLKLGLLDLELCHLDLSATKVSLPTPLCADDDRVITVKVGDLTVEKFSNYTIASNEPKFTLKAACLSGSIHLSVADWIASLKFMNK